MSKFSASDREWRIIAIKRRDGNRCWLCGVGFERREPVTLDHAIPKARGGTNHLHNLRLAHSHCNNVRGCIQSTRPKAAALRASAIRLSFREAVSA